MSTTVLIEAFADLKYEWHSVTDFGHARHNQHNRTHLRVSESDSTFSIDSGLGILDGEVKVVYNNHNESKGPGSVAMKTGKGNYLGAGGNIMPDVSSCTALQLVARSSEPYGGYRISFGKKHVPFLIPRRRGYKANFDLPVGETTTVTIPFDQFTLYWDGATGDAMVTCGDNPEYCPDTDSLTNMKTITIWGQGEVGKVHLEIESISATGCGSSATSASMATSAFNGSNNILVACLGFTMVVFLFALVRRRRNVSKEYQVMDNYLLVCPEKLIPVQTPGTWRGGQNNAFVY